MPKRLGSNIGISNIENMINDGISFGFFPGVPVWVIGIFWVVLFIYAVKMRELWGRVGVGLILIGGAGNIIIRVMYGGVVDDLSLFGLLYNNGWDYLIFLGLLVYGYTYYFRRQ